MKIAICLFGYFRQYKHLTRNFNNLFLNQLKKQAEVDIFFSTWDKLNSNSCFSAKHGNGNCENIDDFDLNDIIQRFQPKDYLVGNFDKQKHNFNILNYDKTLDLNILHKDIHDNETLFNLAQYYHIYNSVLLKQKYEQEHNFKYDLVIVMRPDLFFLKPFNLNDIDENKLCARTFYNEAFFVSNSGLIDKVSSVYINIQNLINKYNRAKFEWFELYCPEWFFEYHLKDIGINLENRKELGEDLFFYYPKKDFIAFCNHIYNAVGRPQDINYVLNYFNVK